MSDFDVVIGLEVHCQLSTETKIFCGCPAKPPARVSVADVPANAATCPVCTAQPGSLPVLNRRAVEYAIKAGLATHCEIRDRNVFARKNYFYPDLPKGYQISQLERPICENGYLDLDLPNGRRKRISIQRIHMEEDAGKNVHLAGYSLVNLNRAGVPLIEIVSGPDMSSAAEAGSYLRTLHAIVTYLGITDGNMQEGNFRCDANVSVKPLGATKLGTRVEIKNVNSFRFVEKAIDFEVNRQVAQIQSGQPVVQETRLYDSARNATASMRSKEEAMDYRYFPDPDLLPIEIDLVWIERLRGELPELPEQRRARYLKKPGFTELDAVALTSSKAMSDFFEAVVTCLGPGDLSAMERPAASLITGEVARLLNEQGIELEQAKLKPTHVADVVRLLAAQQISSTAAKQIIVSAWSSGDAAEAIVERENLRQVSDQSSLEPAVDKVIAAFPAQVAEYRAGKEKVIGFLVGQLMKETAGKGNPALIQQLLKKKLSG